MIENIETFTVYYDSGHSSPRENPDRIQERLEEVAEQRDIECEMVDTASKPDEERKKLYHGITSNIRPEREYHVGNRVLTGGMFGSMRPALVIHYEDEKGIDIYPHRNDEVKDSVIGVLDFLDEVEETAESGQSDYAALQSPSDESETSTSPSQSTDKRREDTSSEPGLGARLLSILSR